MNSICIGGRMAPWKLRFSSRLKKIYIQVHPQEGLIVRAPLGYTVSDVAKVMAQQEKALAAKIAAISRRCPPREYASGQRLPYLGGEVVLYLHPCDGRAYAQWHEAKIDLFLNPHEQNRESVRTCLNQLYLERAKKCLPPWVDKLNGLHFRHRVNRVSVKSQANLLGSCSSRGNVNLNWRLLLAPLEVVDYVIIHELAHMAEMNHSPRFWRVVEGACPQYRQQRAWLKDMSATLYI